MSKFGNVFKGLFGSKSAEPVEVKVINSFSEMSVGNSFSITVCGVLDLCGKSFEIYETVKNVVSVDHSEEIIHLVRCTESGEQYRVSLVSVSGKQVIRIDKEITSDEVPHVFFDHSWVASEDPDTWTPPTDFRYIFDDECNAAFKLKSFNEGEEEVIAKFEDWIAQEYFFSENIAIEGYRSVKGIDEKIQYYFLTNSKKDYGVIIENDEQGFARVYVSHMFIEESLDSFY